MKQSMNIAAVKKRKKILQSRRESPGIVDTSSNEPAHWKACLLLFFFFFTHPTIFARAFSPCSSIVNVPGESTLRRDFIRLQQENKERSEALRRQQLLQEQQLREQEEYKRQLLAERQKRIEQQKEQRRRLEEVAF